MLLEGFILVRGNLLKFKTTEITLALASKKNMKMHL